MARLKDVVDECLLIAEAFSSIKSQTYNEIGAVNFEDNDKTYPLLLFNKSNVSVVVDKYSRNNLPSKSTYTCNFLFLDTYTELEKVTIDLQTKQDALMVIADQYFAELRRTNATGVNGFRLGTINFNSNDESHNERLIQLSYDVEIIAFVEGCTLGNFAYNGLDKPTNLAITDSGTDYIDLAWVDNATSETAYEIHRSTNGTTFSLIDTIASDSTTYTNSSLSADTSYLYKVRVISGNVAGEFSNIVVGCTSTDVVPCLDSTYTLKDTDLNTLYSGTLSSGSTLNQTILDSSITNSNATYSTTVLAEGTKILPDVTHTDSDGSPTVLPAQVPMVCSAGVTPSGIAYNYPQTTGQITSYRTGDDVWVKVNIPDNANPTNPIYKAKLVDFWTLENNNVFGNKFRFTDQSGAVGMDALAFYSLDTLIDNYTGREWAYLDMQTGNSKNWDTSIDECLALNIRGFSDWYLPSIEDLFSMYNSSNNYLAINYVFGNIVRTYWSSTTPVSATTRALTPSVSQAIANPINTGFKTSALNYIAVRKRF